MLQNRQLIFVAPIFHHMVMKTLRELFTLKCICFSSNKNTYKYSAFMLYKMETGETYECKDNNNDRNISLFDWKKIGIIKTALDKDIMIIKKWNVKRIMY